MNLDDINQLRRLTSEEYAAFVKESHRILDAQLSADRNGPPVSLGEGFHGRWEELTLADMKMLHSMAIEIDF